MECAENGLPEEQRMSDEQRSEHVNHIARPLFKEMEDRTPLENEAAPL